MEEKRIADVYNIKTRFLRSANLERDFKDPAALSGYVKTAFIQECFDRIADGLRPKSGRRAWRVTGDYGSGKSSFALLLATELAGRDSKQSPQIIRAIDFKKIGIARPSMLPVLVTCSRQPLGTSILLALRSAVAEVYPQGEKSRPAKAIQRLLDRKDHLNDDEILRAVLDTNCQVIADVKGEGLLLIIDELGKFLEFAALSAHRQDVYLLQCLAEAAARSGDSPLMVICLLHQGFNAYADSLTQSAQREWEKVAGRFDQIIFAHPMEEIANIIASALDVRVDEIPKKHLIALRQATEQTFALGWFGAAKRQALIDLAPHLYPLHPTVLPALIRVFRRFGQNERSLFNFLLSNEPFGLQAFSERGVKHAEPYRLSNLFDYVRTAFGHRLAVASYRSHWNLIESVIESYATEEPLHIELLKTVGLLNLLNDDLLPTEDLVLCAVGDKSPERDRLIRVGLQTLQQVKRVLYNRGRGRGLCLWPHTSVDLEAAYDEARRKVQTPQRVSSIVKEHVESRPIVARRHYIKTGNLRYFEVRYSSVTDATALLDDSTEADGVILVLLCETPNERAVALEIAKNAKFAARPNWLCAVPEPLNSLTSLVQEVQRWDWVATQVLELNADKFAREEVSRQREAAKTQLERRVQSQVGFKQFSDSTTLLWFCRGKTIEIKDGRELLAELSSICDLAFPEAPLIHNELVNRRNLSPAAAAARTRLVERMFAHGGSHLLGMDPNKKPPEMSMYLSVLFNTGVHQEKAGDWRISEPSSKRDEKCRILPALKRIGDLVLTHPDARIEVSKLFQELRRPPFGVRDGMIPLLLTIFSIANEEDVVFYKDGTFLREMTGEHMLVLSKQPERFDIQYCKIEGVRAELFERFLSILEIKPPKERRAELLDVVKPLCVFVAQLPNYVQNTKRLTPAASAVRDAILGAREPSKLLFSDIPKACGFEPFVGELSASKELHAFIKTLRSAVVELRAAFSHLQERMRTLLRAAFDLPGSFQQFRSALACRAEKMVLAVGEPKLRAFCFRLMDGNLPESDWLESLGSFLALKPPAKWHDSEEELFTQELASLSTRFHRVESIVFAANKPAKGSIGIRLAVTQANGMEHEKVIHIAEDEEKHVRDLQAQFDALLRKNSRLGLAAASRAVWLRLENTGKHAS